MNEQDQLPVDADAIERFRGQIRELVMQADCERPTLAVGLIAAAADVAVGELQRDPGLFRVFGSAVRVAMDEMVRTVAAAKASPLPTH